MQTLEQTQTQSPLLTTGLMFVLCSVTSLATSELILLRVITFILFYTEKNTDFMCFNCPCFHFTYCTFTLWLHLFKLYFKTH